MKKQAQQGFTLIELMIVIAIIGILASIAIPQYQIYTQRTEATTSIAGVRTVQLAIQEFYSSNGAEPTAIGDLNQFGIDAQSLLDIAAANPIINTVTTAYAAGQADIIILFNDAPNAPADLAGETMVIRGTGTNGIINFAIDTTDSTLDAKFHPNL
jgi:type IV pilus assembly protein PilA